MSAVTLLARLGARAAARQLGRELRSAGVVSIPRGPYEVARGNAFGLTARQLDILGLLIDQLTTADIAARLSIAPKTVDHHVGAVLAKLGVHSRREAALVARQHRLVHEK